MMSKMRMMIVGGAVALAMGGGAIGAIFENCPQDINCDGFICHSDLGILLGSWGSTGPNNIADLNQDGVVDQQDFGMLLPYFLTECENTSSPGLFEYSAMRLDNSDVRLLDDSQSPSFDGGVTHFSFDVDAAVFGGTTWTSSTLEIVIEPSSPYEIYQSPLPFGSDSISSNEGFAQFVPAVFYDSAVATPAGNAVSFAVTLTSAPKSYGGGVWFSSNIAGMAGSGPVTRLTIIRPNNSGPDPVIVPVGACPGATRIGTVSLTYTAGITEGELQHADFEIIESPFVSDLNGDLVVDTADLGILLGHFGGDHPYSDVNNDGVVDTADLGTVLGEFGFSCP